MAKNTGNTRFRNLNVEVDEYEDEMGEVEAQGPNEGEVQSLLAQNKNVEALKVVLDNPPVTTKNQVIKDRALQLVMKVFEVFRASEIESAVQSLSQTQTDILMKYIYRGFEIPSEGSSAQLLQWHEKAFQSGGLGCIVRVLTDRKRV